MVGRPIMLIAVPLLFVLLTDSAWADKTVTLNAIDSGWYNTSGLHNADNDNYIAGRTLAAGELRNFFVFDLSGVRGSITSATFRIFNPATGYSSVDPFETYTAFDVSTPIAQLMASNEGRTDIHDDLGTGTSYGAVQIFDPSNNFVVAFALNPKALNHLNMSRGGLFAIGGALTSLRGQDSEYLLGGSDGTNLRQLVLTVAPSKILR